MLYFKSRGEKTPLRQSKSAGSSKVSADGIETEIHVDSSYNATSHNAQSGKAVAQATQQSLTKLTSQLGSVLRYKGSVSTYSDLSSVSSKETGDVYDITSGDEKGANYVWTGSTWDKLSEDLTKLVKQTVFDSLKTQIETHTKDQDADAKHLDSANYQKLQQVTVYSSESLDKLIDEVLKEYVEKGELVTEESLQEQLTQVETDIQTSVVESVKTQMSNSFLTAEELATYKSEIDTKKKKLIKCEQADNLAVYVAGDGQKAPLLENRKERTIYLIGEGAEFENGSEPSEPTIDESKELVIGLDMSTQNLGNQDNTYVLDLGPILGEFNGPDASGITQRARIDWGDGTATVEVGENVGRSNQILQHTYSLETHRSYNLKITGDIKWNSYHNNVSTVSTTPIENSLGKVAADITIDYNVSNKCSPIRAVAPYAFENFTRLDRLTEHIFENCQVGSAEGLFMGCTSLDDVPTAFLFDCFSNSNSITSIANIFNGCVNITRMPSQPSLFVHFTNLKDANHAFYNSGLRTIPDDLFSSCSQLQDVSYCFCCCENTEIPEALFSNCPHLKNCSHCFCETDGEYTSSNHITSIPQGLFNSSVNSELDTFTECFEGCSGVTGNVPELWTMYSDASQCAGCFTGCEGCENWNSIPETWGGNPHIEYKSGEMVLVIETTEENQVVNLGYNLGRWQNKDKAAEEIPHEGTITWEKSGEETPFTGTEGIQEEGNLLVHTYKNPGTYEITIKGIVKWNKVSDTIIAGTTKYPGGIYKVLKHIKIPEGKISPIYYIDTHAFYDCYYLETIDGSLFANCSAVTSFESCFEYCVNLQSLPTELFANCSAVTSFESCFYHCSKLTSIPTDLFVKNNKVTNFYCTFYFCEKVTGNLPELWKTHSQATSYRACFRSCDKADNYTAAEEAGWA